VLVVKNVTRGAIPIQYGKGSLTIQSGKSVDLEKYCSRDYIDRSSDIQSLLKSKALIIVSEGRKMVEPPPPAKPKAKPPVSAPPTPPPAKPAPKQRRIRIDAEKSPWE